MADFAASLIYGAGVLTPVFGAVPTSYGAQLVYDFVTNLPPPPPTIDNLIPASGSPLSAFGSVQVDVTDVLGPVDTTITATYANGVTETVFAGGVLVAPYALGGSVTAIVDGQRIQFRRSTGFYAGLTVNVSATGAGGGVATASATYLVLSPTADPAPDVTAPIVSNAVPAPGSTIDAGSTLQFDVTDNGGAFRRIIISALFEQTGIEEVVYDGDGFRGLYLGPSSTQIISGGLRFALVRKQGWPYSPTIKVFAIDTSGNEGGSTAIPLVLP